MFERFIDILTLVFFYLFFFINLVLSKCPLSQTCAEMLK